MKQLVVIQNAAHERGDHIRQFLSENEIAHRWVRSFDQEPIPDITSAAGVIVLGCPYSVNEISRIASAQQVYAFAAAAVREAIPYLGICYGGQLLAKLLGAVVEPYARKEIGGGYTVTLSEAGIADPLLAGFPATFPVFQWHGDTFKIPHGATLLGRGNDCPNQIFRKGNAVAVQFHLDTGNAEAVDWCDTNPGDLLDAGKSKEQVLTECREIELSSRSLSDLLLRNFIAGF